MLRTLNPPPAVLRVSIALICGILCHTALVLAVSAMIIATYSGMSESLGSIKHSRNIMATLFLVIQIRIMYSILLRRCSSQFLITLAQLIYGGTLATIKFAKIASVPLATLFIFWTPSVIIWWQAVRVTLFAMS